ncbi:unnamed protein product [Cyprideis torosa]|uniref:Deoxynucleoside kinase domain-containing protein n=1 Tax=Cyprideis torosa TaxID=163714 RepID=A0A7R8W4S3_9CRUS|nr:unnamed protein product [Cyprideis torosa]CAG0884487.1 unnamed protein product [Cyprideis torosa]
MMYENIHRHGFLAQSFLQLSRMKMHLQKSKKPIKLIERSIFSNRYCFTEMWRQNKTIRDAELCVLEEWFNWFEQNINLNVDLIVYLRTDPEVVYRRLLERNRKEEEGVPFEYLSELHTSYENWLVHRTVGKVPCPVITLDASKALEELKSDYQVVWKHAKEREWIIPVEEIAVGESA